MNKETEIVSVTVTGSFHTREYVDRVKILSAGKGGEVGDETRIAAGGYAIAALAAGGAIVAVRLSTINR